MAYVSKEKKAKIVEAVKAVLPKDWKATFSVRHHMVMVCTIRKAPVDLLKDCDCSDDYYSVNEYHFEKHIKNQELVKELEKIINALNTDNYDNSDIMTDYFNVGHYIELRFGSWDKPFISTLAK